MYTGTDWFKIINISFVYLKEKQGLDIILQAHKKEYLCPEFHGRSMFNGMRGHYNQSVSITMQLQLLLAIPY